MRMAANVSRQTVQ